MYHFIGRNVELLTYLLELDLVWLLKYMVLQGLKYFLGHQIVPYH